MLSNIPRRIINRQPTRDEIEAESTDPYAIGWDAGEQQEEPPLCPFKEGMSARLWRDGFNARINEHIARIKSAGGINAAMPEWIQAGKKSLTSKL